MPKRSAAGLVVIDNGSANVKKPRRARQQSALTAFLSVSNSENGSSGNEVIDLTEEGSTRVEVNNKPPVCSSTSNGSSSTFLSSSNNRSTGNSSSYKIYCDLDGVLVDFEAGVRKIFNGRGPDQLPPYVLWPGITRANGFFKHLPWTSDGKKLWDELLVHYNNNNNNNNNDNSIDDTVLPDILTGVPRNKEARKQKFLWCQRELGVPGGGDDDNDVPINHVDMAGPKSSHDRVNGVRKKGVVNVMTCWSKNKHYESRSKAVLIDDNLKFAEKWEEKGGLFIHHKNTALTLEKLRQHGVLPTI